MNKFRLKPILLLIILAIVSCKSPGSNENTMILMKTTLGDIKIKLYDGTPLHRDNFIKLVNSGIYDGISFHRVINSFMIQAGDPLTRQGGIPQGADTLNSYTLPSEFRPEYFHKKGALAAAREGNNVNPDMRSSGTQFYIVQGKKLTESELSQFEQLINNNLKQAMFFKYLREVSDSARISGIQLSDGEIQEKASARMFEYLTTNEAYKIPADQRTVYTSIGGVPRLDGTYTVFGEVTEGLDVVDKIAAVQTNPANRPLQDVKMKIELVK